MINTSKNHSRHYEPVFIFLSSVFPFSCSSQFHNFLILVQKIKFITNALFSWINYCYCVVEFVLEPTRVHVKKKYTTQH